MNSHYEVLCNVGKKNGRLLDLQKIFLNVYLVKISFIDKYELDKLIYEGKLKEFVSSKPII